MVKFYALANKNSGPTYINALRAGGYEQVEDINSADFLLFDYERGSGNWRKDLSAFLCKKPGFIYPHTPLAYFIWDGAYKPLPVSCNFVNGEAAKSSMQRYGYPYRVEICGFPLCEVREFSPSAGRRLLFVPARTRRGGGYASQQYAQATDAAWQFLLKHLEWFERVDVCYVNDFVDEELYSWSGIHFHKTDPYRAATPITDMLEHIERADLVLSCETVGCLAVARGKPTIFYNARATATTLAGSAQHFERYRELYSFPLTVEEMSIRDVLDVCKAQNSAVELWKERNIGADFDRAKFLSVIEEYL